MTLAEKIRNEGKLEGLRETIELGITLKFPKDIDAIYAFCLHGQSQTRAPYG